jgi:hypothetical protein
LSKAAQAANGAGLKEASQQIVSILLDRFPRNVYAYLVQYEDFSASEAERRILLTKVREIDPLLAICYEPNPNVQLRSVIEGLTDDQGFELARGWGLVGEKSRPDNFDWSAVNQDALAARLNSFCSIS